MKKLVEWRVLLPTIAVLAAVALGASYLLGLSFLPVFVLTVAAVLANGFLATLEDDLPGGFNNPDGTDTPAYTTRIVFVFKCLLALLLVGFSVVFLATWFGVGSPSAPFVLGISVASTLLAVALFIRPRLLLLAAVASGLIGTVVSAFLR
jgi:hypothetical protein